MPLHLGRCIAGLGRLARTFKGGEKLALASECFLKGFWNEWTENLSGNGEDLVQKKVCKHYRDTQITIFDVGANHGEWTINCLKNRPDVALYCFELVPDTFKRLSKALDGVPVRALNEFGLSDVNGEVEASYYPESDSGSSIEPLPWRLCNQKIRCIIKRGTDYCRENNIEMIHFLKIDTEGHEMKVLYGFEEMLNNEQIEIIQFEYGRTWLPPRCQLRDAYELLVPKGYVIGRLFPDGVCFSDYSMFRDEHFRMGNYIAVHGNRTDLIESVTSFSQKICT